VNLPNPTTTFDVPGDGTVLSGSSTELGITIADFAMSDDVGGAAVFGEGHYHVLIDGAYYDYGTDATSVTVPDLTEGAHDITVELVSSDHTSLSTPVSATIAVEVEAGAYGISLDDADFAAELNTATVRFDVATTNFTLSDDAGGYLCNAVLFHGLLCSGGNAMPGVTGFVHIPAQIADMGRGSVLDWDGAVAGGLEIIRTCLGLPAPARR